jgi:hypothetical protein
MFNTGHKSQIDIVFLAENTAIKMIEQSHLITLDPPIVGILI